MTTPREQAKKAAKAVAELLDSDEYPHLGISDLERRLADLILSHTQPEWRPVAEAAAFCACGDVDAHRPKPPIACSHCGKPDAGHVHGAAKPPAERCGGTPKNPRWWLSPSVGLGHRGWHDRTTACDTGMSHKRCHPCPGCPDCKPEEAASNPADGKCPRCGHHPGKHNQRGCNWHDEITCACTLPFGVEPKPEGDWALEAAKGIFPGSDPTLVNWATSIIRRHAPATEPLSEEEKE